jgi:hypothetical protein
MIPVIPGSLAGPRRAPQAPLSSFLVVASFDPDRVSRRHAIGVMCADSLVSAMCHPSASLPPPYPPCSALMAVLFY